jgi:uncharacterized ion transporter superfamily protein YfcC
LICTGVTIIYLLRYGNKVKKDPSRSMVLKYDGNVQSRFVSVDASEPAKINARDRLVLLLFGATFFMLIYGVVVLDWWLTEMSALFFASSLLLAVIMRMKEKVFVEN